MIPQVRQKVAFTLVELLVVIAIVGILAGILIPVVGSLRNSANQAKSSVNLRQLGVALQLFANENKGQIPGWTTVIGDVPASQATNLNKLFFWHILPYISDLDNTGTALEHVSAGQVFKKLASPGVPEDYGYRINVGDTFYTVQFAVNKSLDTSRYVGTDGNGLDRPTAMMDINRPERIAWLTVGVASFFQQSGQDPSFELPASSTIPGAAERIWFPYRKSTNILFLDGHVESRSAPLDPRILNPWLNPW